MVLKIVMYVTARMGSIYAYYFMMGLFDSDTSLMEFITYKIVQMNRYYTHNFLMMMGPTNHHAQAVNRPQRRGPLPGTCDAKSCQAYECVGFGCLRTQALDVLEDYALDILEDYVLDLLENYA